MLMPAAGSYREASLPHCAPDGGAVRLPADWITGAVFGFEFIRISCPRGHDLFSKASRRNSVKDGGVARVMTVYSPVTSCACTETFT